MNGLWRIDFRSNVDLGGGLIVIRGGQIAGGDHGFSYIGEISKTDGENVEASVRVQQYENSVPSIIPGVVDYTLDLAGSVQNDTLSLKGSVKNEPGLTVSVSGRKIRNI